MIMLGLFSATLLSLLFCNDEQVNRYVKETNDKFNSIEDYQVQMVVKLDVPAFRMPKKRYKVFYKKPDKIKVKARGFGILPKTGLFTSPNDNFDNLENLKLTSYKDPENIHDIMLAFNLQGDLTFETGNKNSLSKAQFLISHPNYSGLQFNQLTRAEIPAHFVNYIKIEQGGDLILEAYPDISLSEDPAITFNFQDSGSPLKVSVEDSEGKNYAGDFPLSSVISKNF